MRPLWAGLAAICAVLVDYFSDHVDKDCNERRDTYLAFIAILVLLAAFFLTLSARARGTRDSGSAPSRAPGDS